MKEIEFIGIFRAINMILVNIANLMQNCVWSQVLMARNVKSS